MIDLEAINAALSLGDTFLPPIDTICEVAAIGSIHGLWNPEDIGGTRWFTSVDRYMPEPPHGGHTVFKGRRKIKIQGIWVDWDNTWFLHGKEQSQEETTIPQFITRMWSIRDVIRVVFLPKCCPPFEDWKRL